MQNFKTYILFFLLLGSITSTQAQQTFQLDSGHTFINFAVERFMVGEVTGRFNEFSGTIQFDENDWSKFQAEVSIKVESIDTGLEVRDGHLKSDIWLDAAKYPEITFKSKKVEMEEEQLFMTADLTIHGTTQEIRFPFTLKGPFTDPTKSLTIGLTTDLIVNRQDYGIAFSRKMDNGHLFIGNEVKISIRALAAAAK